MDICLSCFLGLVRAAHHRGNVESTFTVQGGCNVGVSLNERAPKGLVSFRLSLSVLETKVPQKRTRAS